MKRIALFLAIALLLTACAAPAAPGTKTPAPAEDAVKIVLSDTGITVDGKAATNDPAQAVYTANNIVYYPTGKDFTFGEGTAKDAHEAAEADGHTVVHITKAGHYSLSGTLSAGQIAVDLGEDAKKDPNAVVTLILGGTDITCTVAPAIIFYNVYECGDKENPKADVDTSAAGANIWVADGTENNISGAYVARIYKADTVELSDNGKSVKDAKKLHKYDGAVYSRMTMNVGGNDGILNIDAANEGLDTEMHLTINGGDVRIRSGNDGINTNEDGVSVTTVNGGKLSILVTGKTGEGDGIDSNGWLVINGGTVVAQACGTSGDAGIDSDLGIHLNGGTVAATGNMLDHIADSKQNFAVFTFSSRQSGGAVYTLKDANGKEVLSATPENAFSILVVSSPDLTAGDYTLWCSNTPLAAAKGEGGGMGFGGMGGQRPNGQNRPQTLPADAPPKTEDGQAAEIPAGAPPKADGTETESTTRPNRGGNWGGQRPQGGNWGGNRTPAERSEIFTITDGGNYFSAVAPV